MHYILLVEMIPRYSLNFSLDRKEAKKTEMLTHTIQDLNAQFDVFGTESRDEIPARLVQLSVVHQDLS